MPTLAAFEERMKTYLEFAPWLVAEENGHVIGYAYASRHRDRAAYQWDVEVSVYVAQGKKRAGVGRELYLELFELLKTQGFYNAYAGISLPNDASVGFHESLGFSHIGVYRNVGFKKGAWHSVGWWQRALQDEYGIPRPPRAPAKKA